MTIREITALRRSGQIEEALKAAEEIFAHNANNYTAGAVFWCLNEIFATQPRDEAVATLERMKSLFGDFCPDDKYMSKSITKAERLLAPHYQELREAVECVKAGGDAMEHYRRAAAYFEAGELEDVSLGDFGWLTYYVLKATSPTDTRTCRQLLAQYLQLGLPRPALLHSLILGEAVKIRQSMPARFRLHDFIRLWGLENLREVDWEPFKTDDGKLLPSTVEKLISAYVKELKGEQVQAPEDFAALIDKALVRFPHNQNLPYHKATLLILQGRKEEAVEYYRDLILRFPAKTFLWHHLSELVDDPDVRIGLLSKALTLGHDEQFLGNVRLAMADALIEKGLKENAKCELQHYRAAYESRGWNVKAEFWAPYCQLNNVEAAADNRELYAQYIKVAEEFIYSQLPEQPAVKVAEKLFDDRNHPGRQTMVWTLHTAGGRLSLKRPARFGLDSRLKPGTPFSVRIHDGKVVWIKKLDRMPEAEWIKVAEGRVSLRTDRNGHPYAIIDGAYVANKHLTGIAEGSTVRILALRDDHTRWTTIAVKPLPARGLG